MSQSFCDIKTDRGEIHLTRFYGGEKYGRSVQITIKPSADCLGSTLSSVLPDRWISLTADEARTLRDQLSEYLAGNIHDGYREKILDTREK